ncbi:PadR family transcriptional regulator [Krasilnikoviella flava]|uniref:DNA-binding transcriptional regulator, PadR family n=1 Tax=Krasilnikoviella flava TaxID=526729 RepID=A0A1T5IQE3_9MICO|nr:PadR family transcriptional regulator [Krasilnikoviella flava]SKC41371.1 DNA-binding transcriptional regulator, PadR family [Krasilnikoviella flava]
MAHVILGLLLIRPQSLYDLVKGFEAGVSLFYSASSGSIRRALETLLGGGLIEVDGPGARGRKTYRVTDAGRAEFHAWMTGPVTGPDAEAAALPRLFFLGLLEPGERAQVLPHLTARIERDVARLEVVEEQLDAQEVPDELRDVFTYQRATLDYGLASGRFAVDWFRRYAEERGAPAP